MLIIECPTFAPATIIAPAVNPNVERKPNPNPNLILILILTLPRTKKPNHHPYSNSLLSEISSQEQLSLEQMSDHLIVTLNNKM